MGEGVGVGVGAGVGEGVGVGAGVGEGVGVGVGGGDDVGVELCASFIRASTVASTARSWESLASTVASILGVGSAGVAVHANAISPTTMATNVIIMSFMASPEVLVI